MMTRSPPDAAVSAPPRRPGAAYAVLWAILGVSGAIELVLWMADHGWIGATRWRLDALGYGAFWAGLLGDWQPNYPGQRALMFLTYSVLHAGPSHFLGNMITLAWLGPRVIERMGQAGFAVVWGAASLGGAAAFGLLSSSAAPMVGASGALFGLVGALVMLNDAEHRSPSRILWISALLMLFNLAMYVLEQGVLAWQTHAGGYVAGMATAWLWMRSRAPSGAP